MLFSTLSKASLAIIAASILLVLTSHTEAHSYADCVDWRFNNPKDKSWKDSNGHCAGYARRFPLKAKPFAKLDSDDPSRHYQQTSKNPDPDHALACSNGKVGVEPGSDETMASPWTAAYNGKDKRGRKTGTYTITKAGGELCVRWPGKNHAVPNEEDLSTVNIALSGANPKSDPTQQQFLSNIIAKLNYKNCTTGGDTDTWPCGGCFKLPSTLDAGHYVMQWRWRLNKDEWYTSCADIQVNK